MKKSVLVKLTSVFLISLFLLSYLSVFSAGAAQWIEDLVVASRVASLCDQAVTISYDAFIQNNYSVQDGLTVIYGDNISESEIQRQILGENEKWKFVNEGEVYEKQNIEQEKTGKQITYLYMCLKNGAYYDFYSECILCEDGVSDDTIDVIVSSLTDSDDVDQAKKSFVGKRIVETLSNAGSVAKASSNDSDPEFTRSVVVRQIGNYRPNQNSSTTYSIVIYKSENYFKAYYEGNDATADQIYTLVVKSRVVHGSNAEAYSGVSGVYNSTYGNVMAIEKVRAAYTNDFPDGDEYTKISPAQSSSNILGKTITVSVNSQTDSIYLDLDINKVELSYSLSATGTSTVTLAGYNGLFNSTKSMGKAPFTYVTMAEIHSVGLVLSTTTDVSVYYKYLNSSTTTRSYYEQEMYYDSTESN